MTKCPRIFRIILDSS